MNMVPFRSRLVARLTLLMAAIAVTLGLGLSTGLVSSGTTAFADEVSVERHGDYKYYKYWYNLWHHLEHHEDWYTHFEEEHPTWVANWWRYRYEWFRHLYEDHHDWWHHLVYYLHNWYDHHHDNGDAD